MFPFSIQDLRSSVIFHDPILHFAIHIPETYKIVAPIAMHENDAHDIDVRIILLTYGNKPSPYILRYGMQGDPDPTDQNLPHVPPNQTLIECHTIPPPEVKLSTQTT